MNELMLTRRHPCSPLSQLRSAPRRFCQAESPSVYREGHACIIHSATLHGTHTGQDYTHVKRLLVSSKSNYWREQ